MSRCDRSMYYSYRIALKYCCLTLSCSRGVHEALRACRGQWYRTQSTDIAEDALHGQRVFVELIQYEV